VQREGRLILGTLLPTCRKNLRTVYWLQILGKQKYNTSLPVQILNSPSSLSIWVRGKGRTVNDMVSQLPTVKPPKYSSTEFVFWQMINGCRIVLIACMPGTLFLISALKELIYLKGCWFFFLMKTYGRKLIIHQQNLFFDRWKFINGCRIVLSACMPGTLFLISALKYLIYLKSWFFFFLVKTYGRKLSQAPTYTLTCPKISY